MDKLEEIEVRRSDLIREYGEWTYDIPLSGGLWTKGNLGLPHTRLKRVVQIIQDTAGRPISDCRILDLGCLDGIYAIEFALQGAQVTGIDIREANIKKAQFCKECLRLDNVEFIQDDVRNLTLKKYGVYDVILCSGIFYHLNVPDSFVLLENIYEMLGRLLILDTHTSLNPDSSVTYNGYEYYGHNFKEHDADDSSLIKKSRLLSSSGNDMSFWFTRPSLINALSRTGFSSIYECFNPVHLNFGMPGIEHQDRCTFVAIKGAKIGLHTSPIADSLEEYWPEESLSYTCRDTKKQ